MLRRANDHEAAAFFLVERTMRRTRPRVGRLGLKALETPDGRIERDPLGRLRFRLDGHDGEDGHDGGFEPENGTPYRPLSADEVSLWNGLEHTLTAMKPVADNEGNLVSMRLGSRVLSRLPLGGIVTYLPDGTPPFKGSVRSPPPTARPETELSRWREAEFYAALDAFLKEEDRRPGPDPTLGPPWTPPKREGRTASSIVLATLGHGRRHGRTKLQRCPLCRAPVVKDLYNPRIPYGTLASGSGSIRDLRGGYLARLRETYIIADPNSVVSSAPRPEAAPRAFGDDL